MEKNEIFEVVYCSHNPARGCDNFGEFDAESILNRFPVSKDDLIIAKRNGTHTIIVNDIGDYIVLTYSGKKDSYKGDWEVVSRKSTYKNSTGEGIKGEDIFSGCMGCGCGLILLIILISLISSCVHHFY